MVEKYLIPPYTHPHKRPMPTVNISHSVTRKRPSGTKQTYFDPRHVGQTGLTSQSNGILVWYQDTQDRSFHGF